MGKKAREYKIFLILFILSLLGLGVYFYINIQEEKASRLLRELTHELSLAIKAEKVKFEDNENAKEILVRTEKSINYESDNLIWLIEGGKEFLKKDYKAASSYFQNLTNKNKDNVYFLSFWATSNLLQNKYQEAIDLYTEALSLAATKNNNDSDLLSANYYGLAKAYFMKNDFDMALFYAKKCFDIRYKKLNENIVNENTYDALIAANLLANIYLQKESYEDIITLLEPFMAYDDDSQDFLKLLRESKYILQINQKNIWDLDDQVNESWKNYTTLIYDELDDEEKAYFKHFLDSHVKFIKTYLVNKKLKNIQNVLNTNIENSTIILNLADKAASLVNNETLNYELWLLNLLEIYVKHDKIFEALIYVDLLENIQLTEDEELRKNLILIDYYDKAGNYQKSEEILKNLIDTYSFNKELNLNDSIIYLNLLTKYGDILHKQEKNLIEPEIELRYALQKLLKDNPEINKSLILPATYNNLGYLLKLANRQKDSKDFYNKALKEVKKLINTNTKDKLHIKEVYLTRLEQFIKLESGFFTLPNINNELSELEILSLESQALNYLKNEENFEKILLEILENEAKENYGQQNHLIYFKAMLNFLEENKRYLELTEVLQKAIEKPLGRNEQEKESFQLAALSYLSKTAIKTKQIKLALDSYQKSLEILKKDSNKNKKKIENLESAISDLKTKYQFSTN